jgi:hypothetical protein
LQVVGQLSDQEVFEILRLILVQEEEFLILMQEVSQLFSVKKSDIF